MILEDISKLVRHSSDLYILSRTKRWLLKGKPQLWFWKQAELDIFLNLWYDFLDMLQDTGLVHLLILPHLITMVQGLAERRKGKIRKYKLHKSKKNKKWRSEQEKVIIPRGLTFSQKVRLNLRRYSDCCSKDSWIVSFSCRTDTLVIR